MVSQHSQASVSSDTRTSSSARYLKHLNIKDNVRDERARAVKVDILEALVGGKVGGHRRLSFSALARIAERRRHQRPPPAAHAHAAQRLVQAGHHLARANAVNKRVAFIRAGDLPPVPSTGRPCHEVEAHKIPLCDLLPTPANTEVVPSQIQGHQRRGSAESHTLRH